VSFGWIEFVIFTMVFNANIAVRVNEEFLWGRQKKFKGYKNTMTLLSKDIPCFFSPAFG
jgi:hypothetical protein